MGNVLIPKKSTQASKVPTTSDLALGEIAINYADQKIYGRDPSSGTVKELGGAAGSLSIDTTAADLFSASSGTLTADDPGADRLFFWDDSAGRATHLEVGSGLAISGTTLSNTGGLSGTGSVDNAILRADGTGGSTLQSSGLIVDDAVVPYSVTGDAATDVITATGHIYTANQTVIFSAITGGTGLSANTVYFVRNPSGNTFQLSTTSGGAAINFTTNITAGSVIAIQANVAISQNTAVTNSALVLTPKGTGAFILGPKPDGTTTGGNARGTNAVDLQRTRGSALQVASGPSSFLSGTDNTASGDSSFVHGYFSTATNFQSCILGARQSSVSGTYSVALGGYLNDISSTQSVALGGSSNSASGTSSACLGGGSNSASASASVSSGYSSLANRFAMQAHASGQFSAQGDAQRARFVLRNKTTTNAAVELFLDGSSTRLTIPSGKVLGLTINITGISSTGAAVAHYLRQYCLKNVAGTTSQVYAPVTIGTDNAAGTSIALSANDTNDALKVEVTGITSEIWRWVASVDAVEIAYGT
jgi:hypothetical protein